MEIKSMTTQCSAFLLIPFDFSFCFVLLSFINQENKILTKTNKLITAFYLLPTVEFSCTCFNSHPNNPGINQLYYWWFKKVCFLQTQHEFDKDLGTRSSPHLTFPNFNQTRKNQILQSCKRPQGVMLQSQIQLFKSIVPFFFFMKIAGGPQLCRLARF